jgi:hypothetical protein
MRLEASKTPRIFLSTGVDWSFVAAADLGNNGGSTTSYTAAYTVGSGKNRMLVVALAGDSSIDDVTGITYGGIAMTLAGKQPSVQADNRVMYLYYLLNPASGSNNVVITASTAHWLIAVAADYAGIAQSGQTDAHTTNIGADAAISTLTTSLTTVSDRTLVILLENGFDGSTSKPTAGAGLTLRVVNASFGLMGIFDSGSPITPPGAHSFTTNRAVASTTISHVVVSFKHA